MIQLRKKIFFIFQNINMKLNFGNDLVLNFFLVRFSPIDEFFNYLFKFVFLDRDFEHLQQM